MIFELVEQFAKKSITLRRLVRWQHSRNFPRPNWIRIIEKDKQLWESSLKAAKSGPKILIATSIGRFWGGYILESTLAVALTLRGANVHFLLCDGILPACQECRIFGYPNIRQFTHYGPSKDICGSCFAPAQKALFPLGIPIHRYSEFVSTQEQGDAEHVSSTIPYSEISSYQLDEISVGEHALAGALRFYAVGILDKEPYAEPVLRRYFKASLLTTYAMQRIFKKYHFECAVFNHGIYVPQGLIGEVARREKVRVVNWNPAYRKKCFIFSHHYTYHHTLMSESIEKWKDIAWTPQLETTVMNYLNSRWFGTNDWIKFHEEPEMDLASIARKFRIDLSKPCIGMLTNVVWDAQLHYPANAFPNMIEWVIKTIDYFSKRPELQLIIRVHPAEIRGYLPSRQKIADEVKQAFPNLSFNIAIIPPESDVSTYVVMSQCNAVIIYGTKTGVELTSMSIPVIVAGEAWIRNKGLTMDADSREEYFRLLDQLPLQQRLDENTIQQARMYAYHFFFRRMIPLDFMEPTGGNPPCKVQLSGLQDLLSGQDKGLDVICDGILEGNDFIYRAEEDVTKKIRPNRVIRK